MYRSRRLFFLIGIVLCTIPVYAHHLAVVVPQDNHASGITSVELGKILKSETRKWPNGNDVVVVIPKNSAVTLHVLEHLFGMSEAGVKALISAHPASFVQADSDAAVLAIVESKPGALGLVDVHAIQGAQVRVLKVDGRLPMELGYLPH
jgi:hypothetical protein